MGLFTPSNDQYDPNAYRPTAPQPAYQGQAPPQYGQQPYNTAQMQYSQQPAYEHQGNPAYEYAAKMAMEKQEKKNKKKHKKSRCCLGWCCDCLGSGLGG